MLREGLKDRMRSTDAAGTATWSFRILYMKTSLCSRRLSSSGSCIVYCDGDPVAGRGFSTYCFPSDFSYDKNMINERHKQILK